MPIAAIVAEVEAAGYPEPYAVEYEHALYEVKVVDGGGNKIELFVHPGTGKLLRHPKTGNPYTETITD